MKLIIISNRLPVTLINDNSKICFQQSIGGLATGLNTFLEEYTKNKTLEWLWVGWPGIIPDHRIKKEDYSKELQKQNFSPVFLSEKTMDKFYQGFCNKTLWPLFHYFTSFATYDEENWLTYKAVNEVFANKLMSIIEPDDIVWVNDYHFFLLPSLLRARFPHIPIGFFLHIPFPSYEVFQLIPKKWRFELLNGVLGSDLIGFHTHEYCHHFLKSVLLTLGYEHNMGLITTEDRLIKIHTFPMSIAFHKIQQIASSKETDGNKKKLLASLKQNKIILSVDRLDYTKGIINRLNAYELFLEKNSEWHKKITLILIVAPSRFNVSHYQTMKKKVDEFVGQINGRFGDVSWTPILYQYKSVEFPDLIALYNISDVLLVTPIRDGMNLIAKEYIASKTNKKGILILSETAGSAKELTESIIVNPNNIEEIVDAIKDALNLSEEEQIFRNNIMQRRLKNYDIIHWGNEFMNHLKQTKEQQILLSAKVMSPKEKDMFILDFNQAKQRLVLLDYDGTLVPYTATPKTAKPTPNVISTLCLLASDPRNHVVIISGRDKDTLNQWFYSLNLYLVGEHGAWIKEINENWKVLVPTTCDWKEPVIALLDKYVDRLPGAFIEEKEFSIAWHYRNADHEQSIQIVKELVDNLVNLVANGDLQVLCGNKVIEIRNASLNKGNATMHFISNNHYDFILSIGDDVTDEDMFKVLPDSAYSIKVGIGTSNAKFNIKNQNEVINLLNSLLPEHLLSLAV